MIKIVTIDNVHIKIECESDIAHELKDRFSFLVPNFQFHPKFKAKIWNGRINLFNLNTKTLYRGLLSDVVKFCEEREYNVEIDQALLIEKQNLNLTDFFKSITNFELRDYQIDAVKNAIEKERLLLLSPTASGKSLIIYSILRYFDVKCLLIVPTINLVGQMIADFKDYSKGTDWNADEHCHKIYSGQDKHTDKRITVSTWQSLHRLPREYFGKFDLVIVDEAHLAKGMSIKNVLEKLTNAKYRFGTTGTLDGMLTNRMVIQGLLGQIHKVTTTKTLMETGHLSKLTVKCVVLKYSEEERKLAKKFAYEDEIDFILSHNKRNNFLANLIVTLPHNTLLLFNFIERHGKVLYELIKQKLEKQNSDRKLFFVSGATDADTRNDIRAIVEKESNAIIIASSGIFSTGVNIKNLVNIVFAHSGKSRIRTLQSVGRVLRIGNHDFANLYDVVDDIGWKKHKSYSIKHFIERYKMYQEEKFNVKMIPIALEQKKSSPEEK